jgi:hypothetical protein
MSYIVKVNKGYGMNKIRTQSIPLPTKERVRLYVRRNPLIKSSTKVEIIDLTTKKKIILSGSGARIFGLFK